MVAGVMTPPVPARPSMPTLPSALPLSRFSWARMPLLYRVTIQVGSTLLVFPARIARTPTFALDFRFEPIGLILICHLWRFHEPISVSFPRTARLMRGRNLGRCTAILSDALPGDALAHDRPVSWGQNARRRRCPQPTQRLLYGSGKRRRTEDGRLRSHLESNL